MIQDLVTNIEQCAVSLPQMINVTLLYYAHYSTLIAVLFFGFFVFIKNKNDLASRILFAISIIFSLWIVFDLITWVSFDSRNIMFFWSILGILDSILFVLMLYFAYVFIDKGDVSFLKKTIWGAIIAPIVLMTPTIFNLKGFSISDCTAQDNYFMNYIYYLEVVIFFWIIALAVNRFIKADRESKRPIIFLTMGISLFLVFNATTAYVADSVGNYSIEVYGLFGMTIFLGFLAYLIVKFKAFDIKLLATQALVVSQFILIAAMFTFATSTINRTLIAITLAGTAIMGWFLVRSSKKLDERKEQLQIMAAKLSTANDQLRTLDNAKTEFISIASHQLRTPLTAIKGFISMLLEGSYGKLVPQQEDVLNKVYSSNERLVNLVEDLLNVSRMESGRMEFKFAPWDMDKICQEVIDTFALRAKSCKLDLTYIKPETVLPELLIDGVKVREVISNLTDNAIKYTLEGHGGVTLKLEQLGENIRVTVSDTGIGIPETELPYLFAKFSRGKDISRLNTGGTGLGLYVGKSMVENNGGRIWAESDGQDLGSRFIIELPIKQSEELIKKWG